MILKSKDSKHEAIKALNALLLLDITAKQRALIEREIESVLKGDSAEKDAAYFIDFYYKDSKNWMVIHDLRIEHNGLVAQIDHILINRSLDFFVFESKSYAEGVQINDSGEFEAIGKSKNYGISSPIEQNKRHIHALNLFLTQSNLLPKRLGMAIRPNYFNYILIAPNAVVKRPKKGLFNTDNVIKSDTLRTEIDKFLDQKVTMLSCYAILPKILSCNSIEQLGKQIIEHHKPLKINYRKKFGITTQNTACAISSGSKDIEARMYYCASCKKDIEPKLARYCWNHKARFHGKAFCFHCQQQVNEL